MTPYLGQVPLVSRNSLGQVSGLEQLAKELKELESYLQNYCGTDPVFDCDRVRARFDSLLGAYNELKESIEKKKQAPFRMTPPPTPALPPRQAMTEEPYQSYPMVRMTPSLQPRRPIGGMPVETPSGFMPVGPTGMGPLSPPGTQPPPTPPPVITPSGGGRTPPPPVPPVITGGFAETPSGYMPVGPAGTGTSPVEPGPLSETGGRCIPPSIPDGRGGCMTSSLDDRFAMTKPIEMTQNPYSWNKEPADCAPPMIPDASGRGCIPGVDTGYKGGYGGLLNVASMAPMTSAVSFGMGRRFRVVNL